MESKPWFKAIFVRHGESIANVGEKTTDTSNIPLSAKGFEQARQVADILPKSARVLISPMLRARQTADTYLGKHCSIPQVEYAEVQEFTYFSFGDRATTQEERLPKVQEYWNRADPNWLDGSDPGVETFNEFVRRGKNVLETVSQGGTTIVFTHGNFMRLLVHLLSIGEPEDMQAFYQFMLDTKVGNCDRLYVTNSGWCWNLVA
jgi:2,3-bisphosphoglycerate-dependent phosphoglycerate mutase